jgi:DNA polymerase-1
MSKTSNGPKLLLIDGTNLCFREFFSKKNLKHKGKNVDVLYGVFKSLISFHKKWPDHFRIIAWEGGYARRLAESTAGVESGLCPETYKENRRRKAAESRENPDPMIDMESLFEQMNMLQELGLPLTKTLQVKSKGYEADDVLHTYADYANRHNGDAVIISSDQDFYQCLTDNVKVYDPRVKSMEGQDPLWTKERFEMEFNYSPQLWVDKGAIEGEVGASKDNIFGVDGWGPKTANQYVSQYGGCDAILEALLAKPENKRGKREQTYIDQFERLMLAKSLKGMDIIPDIPMPRIKKSLKEEDLKKFFMRFGFMSIKKDIWRLI